MANNNILIKAYTNLNLGDDLFVKILAERYKHMNFKLISSEENFIPFKEINSLERVPLSLSTKIPRIIAIERNIKENIIAKKSLATIHIGGSIFIQSKKWKLKMRMYQLLIKNSNNFFILGANFGPYEDLNYLQYYTKIFWKVNDVSFRDLKSYNLFSDLRSVRLSPDVVFSLETKQYQEIETESYMGTVPYIVISVIDTSHRSDLKKYQLDYESAIIKLANRLIISGYKVVLMSFCRAEGDERAINRILSEIESEQIDKYFYKGEIEEALNIIRMSDGVVATRFHSLILAYIFKKPVFSFIYSIKTSNLLEDLSFEGYSLDIKDTKNININKVMNELNKISDIDIEKYSILANAHFDRLDSLG